MTEYRHLELKRDGHVLTVEMTNPPLHTMVPSEVVELNTMMNDVEADDAIRVLVLTGGSEEYFVRHYDVGELADASDSLRGGAEREPTPADDPKARSFQGFMRRLENWKGITVAAINGNAAGGGFELALACDFRVMRDGDYKIGLPETSVGIIPGAGGTQRMPRLIGVANALDLIIHHHLVDPHKALELGLVNRVFDAYGYPQAVAEFAQGIARRAPLAVQAAKQAVRDSLSLSLDEGIAKEAKLFGELMVSRDAARALRAVAEGEPPGEFEGK